MTLAFPFLYNFSILILIIALFFHLLSFLCIHWWFILQMFQQISQTSVNNFFKHLNQFYKKFYRFHSLFLPPGPPWPWRICSVGLQHRNHCGASLVLRDLVSGFLPFLPIEFLKHSLVWESWFLRFWAVWKCLYSIPHFD